jgi:hypothetical protein
VLKSTKIALVVAALTWLQIANYPPPAFQTTKLPSNHHDKF